MQAKLFYYQLQVSLTFKKTIFWLNRVFKLIKQVLIITAFHSHPASFNDSKDSRE